MVLLLLLVVHRSFTSSSAGGFQYLPTAWESPVSSQCLSSGLCDRSVDRLVRGISFRGCPVVLVLKGSLDRQWTVSVSNDREDRDRRCGVSQVPFEFFTLNSCGRGSPSGVDHSRSTDRVRGS